MGSARTPGPGLTRRDGLVAAAVALLSLTTVGACSVDEPEPVGSPTPTAARPDEEAVADERALLAAYAATVAAFPQLAPDLEALAAQHRAHLAALGAESAEPSAQAGAAFSPSATARATLDLLARAERAASRQRIDACVAADDPERARTLAFIAASEASHAAALGQVRT